MDKKGIERARRKVKEIADTRGIELEKMIAFGSRTREDYGVESDVDMLLVSEDFEGMDPVERRSGFYTEWPYDELPEPELICLTPEEFRKKKERSGNIVKTAAEEGVRVA